MDTKGTPLERFDEILVVGGRQKPTVQRDEWHHYEAGVIHRLSLPTLDVSPVVNYESPPEACAAAEDPSITFKAATIVGDRLYACTQTEVLVYALPDFTVQHYVSLPCFNDVHHVCPSSRGTLLVASTGLDAVFEVTLDGAMVGEWGVLGQDVWDRFDREIDYRQVVTTKPHASHPNYVIEQDGELWVSRFKQRDSYCLNFDARVPISVAGPHDGVVHDGICYFTTVDGRIVGVDLARREVVAMHNLNEYPGHEGALGWCRGLAPLGGGLFLVGFSRLRPTKMRENIWWVKHKLGLSEHSNVLPTRIALYDTAQQRLHGEVDLEPYGLNAVFSIHPLRSGTK